MIKNKSIKKSSIYKGISLAFAGVFAASFIPVNVIETKADYQISGNVGSESIYVYNSVDRVKKGEKTCEIRAAYFGSDAQIPVGLDNYGGYLLDYDGTNTISAISSSVKVTYLTTGEDVKTNPNANFNTVSGADKATEVWGTFEAANAGEYKVTYSMNITLNDSTKKSFETSTIVYCSVASAYFEFDDNAEKVIPSVYDIKMQSELKNIVLPLPTVMGENEKAVDDIKFIASGDTTSLESSDKKYVDITVSGGNGKAKVIKSGNDFIIESKYFNSNDTENYSGEGNYVVKYSYYEGGQFIKSITKTFSVSNEYYTDYKLALSTNGSISSAVTGVASTLPTLIGKTDSKSTPSSENVNIHYTVKAYRKVNGSYSDCSDDHAGAIEDGKFTPWEDGNYKIVYEAEDFYGNKAVKDDIFIDGVKDTQKPEVVIYDASNKANYIDGDFSKGIKEYIDASTALKSVSAEGNIIVYAVGATDNVSDGLKYTRIVKRSATEIEIKDYASYNLIFDFNAESFLSDNYYVKSKLSSEQIEEFNEEAKLTEWLKANKFLIVTNDKTKTVEDGYAYINATAENLKLSGASSGREYKIIYYAEDAAGNSSTQLSPELVIRNDHYQDTAKPEITFVTNLKNSYRKNSVISFESPTASDDDTRMDVVVEYKYDVEDSWRTFEDDKYEIDLSEIQTLIDQGKNPTSVTISVHATDDYGNVGEWSKKIGIVDVNDTSAPVIVSEKYITENTTKLPQNSEIILPTIQVKDDNVNYINSEVYVTRVDEDNKNAVDIAVYGKSEERNTLLGTYTLNAGKVVASYPGKYQVKVVFTDAGNNQITTFYSYEVEGDVIVEDPVITGISTTLGDSGVGEVGEAIDLGTPSIDFVINNDTHAAFGIKDDDSKAANSYIVKVVNDAPSSYKFNENEENTFTAYDTGVYKLQYFVKFSVFNTAKFKINAAGTAVVEKDTDASVYPLENGDFVIAGKNGDTTTVKYAVKNESTGKYVVYNLSEKFESDSIGIKVKSTKYYLTLGDTAELVAPNGGLATFGLVSDKFSVNGAEVVSSGEFDLKDYTAYNLQSQQLTIEVKDTKAPVMLGNYDYPATANVGDTITIHKPEAQDASSKGIDLEKSYVLVSIKGGSTSYSKTYKLNNWASETDFDAVSGNIKYKVTDNGTCTIKYYIYDYAGNLNSDCEHEIAVGDCVSPKVTIAENFVKESYSLGEISERNPLVLDFSKLSFSDDNTSVEKLKETLKIVVKNTSTDTEVTNTGDAESNIYRYVPTEVGTYEISVSVKDEAGWTTTKTATFEIKADSKEGTEVHEVVGVVLIVVAVAILAGVVTYFVVSAVKNNKKKGKSKKAEKSSK